jgi:hypothetical protein
VTITPDSKGGYVLDGFGGLHPFTINGNPLPPAAANGPYFSPDDIARGVSAPLQTGPDVGGWVVDAFGTLYPWGKVLAGSVAPTDASPFWPDFDIARGMTSFPGAMAGLEVDGYGGLHPFASPGLP